MTTPQLEEVFKTSGVPTHTFVQPSEYDRLIVGLRTAGRGLVIEGPSGIGKTTGVMTALRELGLYDAALLLSARKEEDRKLIAELPTMDSIGTVLVDDFHRLDATTKQLVADYMKTLADEERADSKLVVVGINKAGDSLISFAADLNNRIDTISLETNSEERVEELLVKGEAALNICFNNREQIVQDAHGSFHITQMLARELCLIGRILDRQEKLRAVEISLEIVREKVLEELGRVFFSLARRFSTGPKLRREGRAPYLHMLNWLARKEEWSIQLEPALSQYPQHRGSVGQVIEKGYLEAFIMANPDFADVLHYDPVTTTLSAEDPKFVYYLKNLIWGKFSRQVGYLAVKFVGRYDFALSFAGADRDVAAILFEKLTEAEVGVFYDHNEQHRILAASVEDYLAPIYRSEAQFVIALLGKDFPKRIWTKFESDQFKSRFGEGSVIPIWFADAPPGMFDETTRVGGFVLDRANAIEPQLEELSRMLSRKLAEMYSTGQSEGEDEAGEAVMLSSDS